MNSDVKKDENVGAYLKRIREKTRKSTVRVAKEICIRRVYLEAIEEGEYDKTPGIAYTIGFIRSYATHLGLDPDEMVNRFNQENNNKYYKDQFDNEDNIKKIDIEVVDKECTVVCRDQNKVVTFLKDNKFFIGIFVFVLLAFLVIGLIFIGRSKPSSVSRGNNVSVNDSAYFQVPNKEKEEEKPKKENVFEGNTKVYGNVEAKEIVLKAFSEVWIQVTDTASGQVLFSKILLTGDEYKTESNKNYSLVVGNAGGLRLFIDGDDKGFLGSEGQKKVDIILDKKSLKGYSN